MTRCFAEAYGETANLKSPLDKNWGQRHRSLGIALQRGIMRFGDG